MVLTKRKDGAKSEKEKVDERREEVLAKGRKFKYPVQWTRHRVVIIAIIVALAVMTLLVVGGWAALYRFGMTDSLLFNMTKVVPLKVAKVDGEDVKFSDYLMLYRSSMTSAERQSGGQLGGDLSSLEEQYKRAALDKAEEYVYALKLALEMGIDVSDEEVAAEFERHLKIDAVFVADGIQGGNGD